MPGFWTTTPDGRTIHISGNQKMSKETLFTLAIMMDAAHGGSGELLNQIEGIDKQLKQLQEQRALLLAAYEKEKAVSE